MPSIRCQCEYDDFKLCVSNKKDVVYYCHPAHSITFICASYIEGVEHIYEGHEPSTFFTDYPKAIEVKGITVI